MSDKKTLEIAYASVAQARRLFLHYTAMSKSQIDLNYLRTDLSRLVKGFEAITNELEKGN